MLGKKEIKELLQWRFSSDQHTKISEIPLPRDLKDTYKAALRIKRAIENDENIAVVGDYDVDGVVSSVVIADFLDEVGANYIVKIPNRFTDGYGLNPGIVNNLANIDLIITVDNGISATESAQICLERGIDLIITDHHMPPPVLPKAYAIINPKQDDCLFPNIEICGAEVAWYLVGALKDVCGVRYDMASLLDLLVIAIIADMMELRDLNRVLLRLGIKKLNSSKRACFKAIKEHYFKKRFEFDDISYLIAPLINCTGRMDDATLSYKFLCAKDIREANYYLEMINKLNTSRKEEERNLYESSLEDVDIKDEVIIAWGQKWHEGVIGIVASRLSKSYKKPAIVFSIDKDRAKGSARSIGKFDILNLIASQEDILLGYGGHRGAAGLVIDPANLKIFKERVNSSQFLQDLKEHSFTDELLGELDLDEFDNELLEILEFFEPYGQKNPKPIFSVNGATIENIRLIGRDQNHIKISIVKGGVQVEGLFFNFDYMPKEGEMATIIASVAKNNFKGNITPELIIKEIINQDK